MYWPAGMLANANRPVLVGRVERTRLDCGRQSARSAGITTMS